MALARDVVDRAYRLRTRPKLKVLSVGTGRDGTQSLNQMIQHVFAASGSGQSMHEYCCREIYQAFCDFCESGSDHHAGELERMIENCPYDSIVGNGYAAVLPLFAQHCGPELKIIHLYRADRDACIASLIKNCEMFPAAYGYYSSDPNAVVKRMAAFHFGEMPRTEWDRLSLKEKLAWYHDKTHALVRQYLSLFNEHIEIATESLNEIATRREITNFVSGRDMAPPPKIHLNASAIDISSFPTEHQTKMNWLMGRLNVEELAQDDVYALNYFLEKFVAWTGYQITNAPQLDGAPRASMQKIASDLERAAKILNDRLRDLGELRQLVRNHGDSAPQESLRLRRQA
jgi:hypothetical protein